MCGIFGAFGDFDFSELDTHLTDIEDAFSRRGPDQKKSIKKDIFFGTHARLIVQGDKNDGIQPFVFQKHNSLI